MSAWTFYDKRFRQFLQLERSLSINSIEAYQDDLKKLESYSEIFLGGQKPIAFTSKQLQDFAEWIAKMGFSAATQARIISGLKSFVFCPAI